MNRPRGLCWTCYYTPGIRERYPISLHPSARRGVRDFFSVRPAASEATGHVPGSLGKIEVLEARAAAGVDLWHARDAELDGRALQEAYAELGIEVPREAYGPRRYLRGPTSARRTA